MHVLPLPDAQEFHVWGCLPMASYCTVYRAIGTLITVPFSSIVTQLFCLLLET